MAILDRKFRLEFRAENGLGLNQLTAVEEIVNHLHLPMESASLVK